MMLHGLWLFLLLGANPTNGDCGHWAYEDCLGDDDKRYDDSVSYDLKSFSPLWGNIEGYWVGTTTFRDQNNKVLEPGTFNLSAPGTASSAIPYAHDNITTFRWYSVQGTRFIVQQVNMFSAPPPAFCEANPDNSTNVIDFNVSGSAVCGTHGFLDVGQRFFAATHEKDGRAFETFATGPYDNQQSKRHTAFISAATEDVFQSLASADGGLGLEQLKLTAFDHYVFSPSFTDYTFTHALFMRVPQLSPLIFARQESAMQKQNSKEEFVAKFKAAMADKNIPLWIRDQIPILGTADCVEAFAQPCPTKTDWAKYDAKLTDSPYQEQHNIKVSVVIGFSILGAVLLLAFVVIVYELRIRSVKKSAHKKMARHLAALQGHDELVNTFKRLDMGEGEEGGNGLISKDEFRKYIQDEQIELTEKEFDTFFKEADADHSGQIDFGEFCALVGLIRRETKGDNMKKAGA